MWHTLPFVLAISLGAAPQGPVDGAQAAKEPTIVMTTAPAECWNDSASESGGGRFESDRAFPGFIGPISNPILSKDPRSLTEARPLYIYNKIDPSHPLGSGNFDVYAMQLRVALTDRLTFIADKDGYATIHPQVPVGTLEGWLDLAAGLKYVFVRDVENQFLVTGGFMYEIPNGEAAVFQNQGGGLFTLFGTIGKEFAGRAHILDTFGTQLPTNWNANSSLFYNSLHLDYALLPWLYPLIELNWLHYTSGGNRGIPAAIGEGDGLINIGTSGVAGNDLVTTAVGLKCLLNDHLELGTAWEVPISNRHDLINNRLLVEAILRY